MEPVRPYAGFWIRFAAALLDSLFLLVPMAVVAEVAQRFLTESRAQIVSYAMSTLLQIMYFGIVQGELETTLGKKILGLCVVDSQFERLGAGRGILRYVVYNLGLLPFGLGAIWAAFHEKKQGWHDLAVGSLVMRQDYVKSLRSPAPPVATTPEDQAPPSVAA